MNRKQFLKNTSLLSAAALAAPSLFAQTHTQKVKIAVIGTGLRGQDHIELLLKRNDVDITAICDIDEGMLAATKAIFTAANAPLPTVYKNGKDDWRNLLDKETLDAVLIATPWEWHAPMCIAALKKKIYVATEVVLGITLQDHWDVVNTCEKYNGHLMMLENVCYRRDVMAILHMVRKGLFGELIHLQGGYQHDLRGVKFNDGKTPYNSGVEFGEKAMSEARWRTQHSVDRNADLYPTHGIGPLATMLNINYGNQFTRLSSYATKAKGLLNYIVAKGGEQHPNAKVKFALGDVVTTQIQCANGETILLQHDTNLPRPYSLGFRVQGTQGLWMDVNQSLYIEGTSAKAHQWEAAKKYLEEHDHPLWKKYGNDAQGAGHGGMDFFVLHAFIESVKAQAPTPMDVYDAAAWSAITPLSEQSIAQGNTAINFPDFTNGKWKNRTSIFALNDAY